MSTSALYGDLQGIIGGSLPAIQHLELPGNEVEKEETPSLEKPDNEAQTLF